MEFVKFIKQVNNTLNTKKIKKLQKKKAIFHILYRNIIIQKDCVHHTLF